MISEVKNRYNVPFWHLCTLNCVVPEYQALEEQNVFFLSLDCFGDGRLSIETISAGLENAIAQK